MSQSAYVISDGNALWGPVVRRLTGMGIATYVYVEGLSDPQEIVAVGGIPLSTKVASNVTYALLLVMTPGNTTLSPLFSTFTKDKQTKAVSIMHYSYAVNPYPHHLYIGSVVSESIRPRAVGYTPGFVVLLPDAVEIVIRELFSYSQATPRLIGAPVTLPHLPPIDIPSSVLYQLMPPLSLPVVSDESPLIEKKTSKRKKPKGLIASAFIVLWIALLPYLLIGFSLVSAGGLYSATRARNMRLSSVLAKSMKTSASLAAQELRMLSQLPLVGGVSASAYDVSTLLVESAALYNHSVALTHTLGVVGNGIIGKSSYTPKEAFPQLTSDISAVQESLSRVESKVYTVPQSIVPRGVFTLLKDVNEFLSQAALLAHIAPSVVAQEGEKTYLILFQNNMELRPAGGFIGSFALLTFSHGVAKPLEIYDVYSADGQIKGYVKPPYAISTYLGEASWTLRDSNWDPSFPASARSAEWFLEKAMDRTVDGVVAINLSFLGSIVQTVGPLPVGEYEDVLTSENFYTTVQTQVEDSFFPGSQKKKSYLSAVYASVRERLTDLSAQELAHVLLSLQGSLASREIQFYLPEAESQNVMSVLGWTGEVTSPQCEGACQVLFVGNVEANVGVNKVNASVTRSAALDVTLSDLKLKNSMTYTFVNASDKDSYDLYNRMLVSSSARPIDVRVNGESIDFDVTAQGSYQEIGAYVSIPAGQSISVTYLWEEPWQSVRGLSLFWRKQSGVLGHPIEVHVKRELTNEAVVDYNTVLTEDMSIPLIK